MFSDWFFTYILLILFILIRLFLSESRRELNNWILIRNVEWIIFCQRDYTELSAVTMNYTMFWNVSFQGNEFYFITRETFPNPMFIALSKGT